MTILPRLELADVVSGLDEAVIIIDGREEDQIIVSCEGSLELADLIIRLVNEHRAAAAPADETQTPYEAGPGAVRRAGDLP